MPSLVQNRSSESPGTARKHFGHTRYIVDTVLPPFQNAVSQLPGHNLVIRKNMLLGTCLLGFTE